MMISGTCRCVKGSCWVFSHRSQRVLVPQPQSPLVLGTSQLDTTLSRLLFSIFIQSSLVRFRTIFLTSLDYLSCVWNRFWSIIYLVGPAALFLRHPIYLRVGTLSAHTQLLAQRRPPGILVLAKLRFRVSGLAQRHWDNTLVPSPYGWWHLVCDVNGSGIHVSADQRSRPLHSTIILMLAKFPLSITPAAPITCPPLLPFFSLFLCFALTLPYLAAFSPSFLGFFLLS